jgi:hypothetical protein
MINKDKKLINTLKKMYEGKEYSTSFEDEIYSWQSDDVVYEDWDIRYYLKLNQVLGEGSDAVVSFDVIITDIIYDGDWNRFDIWADTEYDEYAWFITRVRDDIYDNIVNDFPVSFYFNFYTEEQYKNMDNQEEI